VRIVCPFTVCQHGREEAVVAQVEEGYDDLRCIGDEDVWDYRRGAEADVD
jgi:hypothetical protein